MEVCNLGAGGGASRHERDLALVGPISGDGLGSCDEEVTVLVRRALDDQRILGVVTLQLHSSPCQKKDNGVRIGGHEVIFGVHVAKRKCFKTYRQRLWH